MRPLLALSAAIGLSTSACAGASPSFAPSARQAFEGFVGINPPRAEVPVGALWIEGYGPTGEPAPADNVETVRSLNGLTIDKNLQLSLSFALFDLLGIEPKARGHYAARFADLSIVKVKELARLSGPKGEPRIIEALKAGTVTVSSDSEFGLNGQKLGFQNRVDGSGTTGRTASYAIEARDMFIAIRVASYEIIESKERELKAPGDSPVAALDGYAIALSREHCAAPSAGCRPKVTVGKPGTGLESLPPVTFGTDDSALLTLPVPIADGQGGLYTALRLRWVAPCAERARAGCRKKARLYARYAGTRLEDAPLRASGRW